MADTFPELIIDNFAGGGGASTGIEWALGRSPDVAVNHDPEAVAMHAANHPETTHLCGDVWEYDPRQVTAGLPVGLAWFSPDCKHFSKSKGAAPRSEKIRALADVVVRWGETVAPRVMILENVEEFQDWGPLHADGRPDATQKGLTFRRWWREIEHAGYHGELRQLVAADYGSPTTRKRLYVVFRRDGRDITWPEPTHAKDGAGGLKPWRSAAECVDWSIPCPSIFTPGRDLVPATLRRVARGAWTYVATAARPFVVTMRGTEESHVASSSRDVLDPLRTVSAQGNHHYLATPYLVPLTHQGDVRVYDPADPMRTVTGARRGEVALVAPYFVHVGNGERPTQAPRIYAPGRPLGTAVAQGNKQRAVAAYLVKHYGGHESRTGGQPVTEPTAAITARDHHALGAAFLVPYYRTGVASSPEDPCDTVTSHDRHALAHADLRPRPLTADELAGARRVARFLRDHGYPAGDVVEVRLGDERYVVVDLGMRMLLPRELFRAQGFPDSYVIDPYHQGRRLSKTAQVRMCGNSVCPQVAAAIVRANFAAEIAERGSAAKKTLTSARRRA